jgi:hypothetical protein
MNRICIESEFQYALSRQICKCLKFRALIITITNNCIEHACERLFFVMRRIKNWTRNTMANVRFTNLSILHIERDLSYAIESENILNIFVEKHRRLSLI